MKLSGLIRRELICLNLESTEKDNTITEMVEMLAQKQVIKDKKIFVKEVLEREKLNTTGIGRGVAIPHARTEMVEEVTIALGRSQGGIDFESLDSKPVYLIFLITSPTNDNGLYLRTLARLSRLLKDRKFRQNLLHAKTADEILSHVSDFEERFAPISNR